MSKEMNSLEFKAKLKEIYNGAVVPLTNYVNPRSTLVFQCSICRVSFFGKPSHIVGKEHQRHSCNMPYGDKDGERLFKVGGKNKTKKKETLNVNQFYNLVWNDYTYKEIAQELKINPNIVKDYFEKEGLI
jgi:hypothetical protein